MAALEIIAAQFLFLLNKKYLGVNPNIRHDVLFITCRVESTEGAEFSSWLTASVSRRAIALGSLAFQPRGWGPCAAEQCRAGGSCKLRNALASWVSHLRAKSGKTFIL